MKVAQIPYTFTMHNGMNMSADGEGSFTLVLSKPIGAGTMKGYAISQNLFVANVDFSCERCPNMAVPGIGATDPAHEKRGVWFTINRCIEGRCETAIPESGVAVVAEGDVCVSCSTALPESFSYPLARYRGIELFVCCDIDDEAAFALLGEAHSKTKQLAALAGSASVFTQDDELLEIIDRMAECAQGGLKAETKLCALNLFVALSKRDFSTAKPQALLTRRQLDIAKSARDEIEADILAPHDARTMAQARGLSATTLNSYFSRVYGTTISAYVRKRRIDAASKALLSGESISAAAIKAGYSNPSKFAAAFKREMGVSPSAFKRRPR